MISIFDIFKIGIGPSSSHTVGPMKAARAFAECLGKDRRIDETARVTVRLLGSLAWTGKGHATDRAVILGLAGALPDTVSGADVTQIMALAQGAKQLQLNGDHQIAFDPAVDVVLDLKSPCPRHPNTMVLAAFDAAGARLAEETWLSIGGGFIVREDEAEAQLASDTAAHPEPYQFGSAADLLSIGRQHGLSIAEIVRSNELSQRTAREVDAHIHRISDVMFDCIERGMGTEGELPGGLHVRRRAKAIHDRLKADNGRNLRLPHEAMDWVSLFAIAVNEENAAGGRVVTAPTNGAAGVVPAVLRYYRDFCPGANEEGLATYLLTATAIAALFKLNASISGAEVGCQGEVGVASSMAAAGLAAALGGSNAQIENAAEISMEHHLGMTCDPIGGLVQIPCIERNAFGAVKSITAASLALRGDGSHKVSLDHVIATMRQTGADMQTKYKETSQGGLAVNYTEC
jgi:L-serine dehydratase